MPNLMPGAVWRPVPVAPSRPRRRKGRAVVKHIAVSEARSLHGYFSTADTDSHLYVARDGSMEQYVDLDLIAYATGAGNLSVIAVETQGGMRNADTELWTDEQCESLARIDAYAHTSEGVPLQVMRDSRPGSRGIGWHRLGVDPFRVAGGELWSSARGKRCPGDGRIEQVPGIIARAAQLVVAPLSPIPFRPARPLPAGTPGRPPVLGWPLPAGHWLGNLEGPARQHGGHHRYDPPAVRDFVRNVQQWLLYRGVVPGVPAGTWATSRWADGRWEGATDAAMTLWHRKFYPGQPHPAQCWRDDYVRLTG